MPKSMPLSPSTRLGPYEILCSLGAGGMGEVYLARDTRLDRKVAIKVLPAHLAANPERCQRFEREARAISSLSHPNICSLFDIGHHEGADFLVMEYLEGQTLAERLEKAPLGTEQLLGFATQIADALDKAHRRGIVHRDLKPGNIMLTRTGVKLLDFGLAKPTAKYAVGVRNVAEVLTESRPKGIIVGTVQYMAPEQLEGKEEDPRTDIFAFGAVLYEMATGRKAFGGKSQASVVAAILSEEPPLISTLQPTVPLALDRVVKTCLAKDPDERWQTAYDLMLELKLIAETGCQAGVPVPVLAQRKRRDGFTWGIIAVTLLVAISSAVGYFRTASVDVRSIRFSILPPEKSVFYFMGYAGGPVAVSPDGRRLVFVATIADGKSLLWVRSLDALDALPLPGTEGASFPCWSPDGRFIGFFADGKLKKIEASGGPAQTLSEAPFGRGCTMSADGVILFTPNFRAPIYRVSAAGGSASPVTEFEGDPPETTHRWPYFLPDGRHFLYLALHPGGETERDGIYVATLDLRVNRLLLRANSNAVYALGYLLFSRDNTLMAQPLDAKRLQLSGDAFPVAEYVQYDSLMWRGIFSASQNGILAFQGGGIGQVGTQLLWLDQSGKPIGEVSELAPYFTPRLSPNGRKLAVQISNRQSQNASLWLYELSRGTRIRFTFNSFIDANPVWSPDGRSIVFASNRTGHFDLYQKASSGATTEEVLLQSNHDKYPMSWSPDGRFIAYYSYSSSSHDLKREKRGETWVLPLFGARKPFPFLQTNFEAGGAQFSPDGRWIAYASDESGRYEIYVAPFPGPGASWQISATGGLYPVWRRDGTGLFYVGLDNSTLMAAEVNARGSNFQVRAVRSLFQRVVRMSVGNPYDVSIDGLRFLVNTIPPAEQNPAPITLVINWTAGLRP